MFLYECGQRGLAHVVFRVDAGVDQHIDGGVVLACARQALAASLARRNALALRKPWLVSALAASMRAPIAFHLSVDGEYGHADLYAGGD